jgi:hypothetical protein
MTTSEDHAVAVGHSVAAQMVGDAGGAARLGGWPVLAELSRGGGCGGCWPTFRGRTFGRSCPVMVCTLVVNSARVDPSGAVPGPTQRTARHRAGACSFDVADSGCADRVDTASHRECGCPMAVGTARRASDNDDSMGGYLGLPVMRV